MFYWTVFYLTTAYFFIGALAIFFINRRRGEATARWKKFFIYALIVYGMENAIMVGRPFPYVCVALLLVGFNEIIYVWHWHAGHKWHVLLIAVVVYGVLAYWFCNFAQFEDIRITQLYIYLAVLTFDGFSQLTGQLIGRHKLAPKISPNKTIEGAAGGLLISLLTAVLLRNYFVTALPDLLLITLALCVAALAGDLLASWYKRLNNVKDYSRLIPGHGGVLDRFDSFIMAGAVWWAVSYIHYLFTS